MYSYISFSNPIPCPALPYQVDAVQSAQPGIDVTRYDRNGYKFTLQRCQKHNHTYIIIRDDDTLSGIISTDPSIGVMSTREGVETAIISADIDDGTEGSADRDYCVEYRGGVVEIQEGDRIWVDGYGRIMIGWHGTYSPPRGM